MELVSMNLAHERELKDLQRRIMRLEKEESFPAVKPTDPEYYNNIGESLNPIPVNQHASKFDKKFSKLDAAIKKLKDDLLLSNFNKNV